MTRFFIEEIAGFHFDQNRLIRQPNNLIINAFIGKIYSHAITRDTPPRAFTNPHFWSESQLSKDIGQTYPFHLTLAQKSFSLAPYLDLSSGSPWLVFPYAFEISDPSLYSTLLSGSTEWAREMKNPSWIRLNSDRVIEPGPRFAIKSLMEILKTS